MPIYRIKDRIPSIDKSAWVAPSAEIIGDVQIGKNCYIGWGTILRGDYGTIIIGDESAIEEGVIIHARPMGATKIGFRATLGHGALVHNATIRDYALIGMRATVSDFAEVGEWAIVAEHALVPRSQSVPPGKIYAGVPAKEIGEVKERNKAELELTKQVYVDLAARYGEECSIIGK